MGGNASFGNGGVTHFHLHLVAEAFLRHAVCDNLRVLFMRIGIRKRNTEGSSKPGSLAFGFCLLRKRCRMYLLANNLELFCICHLSLEKKIAEGKCREMFHRMFAVFVVCTRNSKPLVKSDFVFSCW